MSENPRQIAVVRSYDELLAVMRSQVQALGINYAILDDLTKFSDTYATKMLGHAHHLSKMVDGRQVRTGRRALSAQAFDAYLAALGFDLIAVENPENTEKIKKWLALKLERRVGAKLMLPMRSMPTPTWLLTPKKSSVLNKLRNKKLPAERRREIARNAALKRWNKPQITEITPAPPQPDQGALLQSENSGITRGANKKKGCHSQHSAAKRGPVRRR